MISTKKLKIFPPIKLIQAKKHTWKYRRKKKTEIFLHATKTKIKTRKKPTNQNKSN